MIVADTNLIAYFQLRGEEAAAAERVYQRDPHWIAPPLWRSEFLNVLALYLRRGDLTLDQALAVSESADAQMAGHEYGVVASDVLRLSAASGRAAYDCEFVALAQAHGVPLVTADRAVLAAFPETAVAPARFAARG